MNKLNFESFGFVRIEDKLDNYSPKNRIYRNNTMILTHYYGINKVVIQVEDRQRTPNIDRSYKRSTLFRGTILNDKELMIILNQVG